MSQTRKIARRIVRITETLEALSALPVVHRREGLNRVDPRRVQFDKVAKRGQRPSWALIGNTLSGERRRMKQEAAK